MPGKAFDNFLALRRSSVAPLSRIGLRLARQTRLQLIRFVEVARATYGPRGVMGRNQGSPAMCLRL